MCELSINAYTTGNPYLGTNLLEYSKGTVFGALVDYTAPHDFG